MTQCDNCIRLQSIAEKAIALAERLLKEREELQSMLGELRKDISKEIEHVVISRS